ncbi:diaminopimelate decarboxylase [Paenibacillus sp. FSL H8-0537]|uniref:diaminopimelate decarboxylase n=1 Tax=Paenibacillus sp. FSL H8-0537 TaxID=2921399 RepID=UPI003100BD18
MKFDYRQQHNVLCIQNIPVTQLAATYGTPLFIYDADRIRKQVKKFSHDLHPSVKLFYSLKPNPNPTIVKMIYDMGANLEICSPNELEICKQIGASSDRLLYLGPGKTQKEIEMLLDEQVGYYVVESVQELKLLNEIAEARSEFVTVGVRINLNTSAKGSKLTMGGQPRQFGIDEEQMEELFHHSSELRRVQITGIHAYNGTRILSADVIIENTRYILELAKQVARTYAIDLEFVDIGGGFGIPYFDNEGELDFASACSGINVLVEQFHKEIGREIPIFVESGRYVVGESGVYTTKVLYTKKSKEVLFATADGGTNHHMAAGGNGNALKKNFPIKVLNKWEDEPVASYHISGPLCTPNDLIAKSIPLPKLEQGDLVGIMNAGAYALTASPTLFLSHPMPVELLIDEGEVTVIRERDEYGLPRLRSIDSVLAGKPAAGMKES